MSALPSAITNLTVGTILAWLVGFSALVTIIVEFSKGIQSKPITQFLSWIGSKTNQVLLTELGSMKKGIKDLKSDLDDLREDYDKLREDTEKRNIIHVRVRILRFGEEVKNGVDHSKESYDQALEDIDTYEKYCASHPKFVNNKTARTKKLIIASYDKHMENGDF